MKNNYQKCINLPIRYTYIYKFYLKKTLIYDIYTEGKVGMDKKIEK